MVILICWLDHHLGNELNLSPTIKWVDVTLQTDVPGPQRYFPFGDTRRFPLRFGLKWFNCWINLSVKVKAPFRMNCCRPSILAIVAHVCQKWHHHCWRSMSFGDILALLAPPNFCNLMPAVLQKFEKICSAETLAIPPPKSMPRQQVEI